MRWTRSLSICFVVAISGLPAGAQSLDQAVGELANQLGTPLQEGDKTKIAIVEFTNLSQRVTRLGRLIAEELTSQLVQRGGRQFQLVERVKVDEIFDEAGRAGKGQIEDGGTRAVAALQGVDAILAGSAAEIGSRVRLNARLMTFPGGELLTAASAYLSKDGLPPEIFEVIEDSRESQGSDDSAGVAARTDLKGVTYELLGCAEAPRLISCELVLTNNLADRKVRFYARYTFMHDQRGYKFDSTGVRIADVEGVDVTKRLIAELPVPMTVSFTGVPSAIDFVKILHLRTSDGELEFRDVLLETK